MTCGYKKFDREEVPPMNTLYMLLTLVGLVLMIPFLLLVLILLCAKIQFIWTKVEENHAMIIVKGDQYQKTILAKKDWRLKKDGSEGIEKVPEKEKLLTRFLGVHYMGIPFICRIYFYYLEWMTWKMDEKDDQYRAISEKKKLDLVYLADYPYYVEAKDVEAKDLIPFSFAFIITARVMNPYKAVFVSHDWVRQMTALVRAAAIKYAGTKTFEEIVDNKKTGAEECSRLVSREISKTLLEEYGVEIVSISVQDIKPDENFRELTLKKTTATREAEAEVARAEGTAQAARITALGRADALRTEATGQAEALKTRATALDQAGESGKTLVQADVAQELAKNGKTTVFTIDGVMETAAKLLGGKKP